LAGNSPLAGHGLDVTETFAAGVRSLRAHRAYLAGLGDTSGAGAQAFLESIGRRDGDRLGCAYAVSFEVLAP
ncbi:MAG TPA: PIG-L family deacetylase, partial [Micromonosporaceae bacterium]|nr:PIG-L family deacetylase [Micromonosporaceae bacterium]